MPTDLVATRLSLQAVAEHVMAAARHAATGRIGLRVAPGGFTTPPFPSDAGDRTLAVDGVDFVVRDDRGEQRRPLTTVAAAAALAGVVPGAPTDVFTPTTPLEPDAALTIDLAAATALASWYALGAEALSAVRRELVALDPSEIQLWPEHFDVGFSAGDANWGASPGDTAIAVPYLYVGPWTPPAPDGGYWNQSFGSTITIDQVPSVDAAIEYFRQGRRHLDL